MTGANKNCWRSLRKAALAMLPLGLALSVPGHHAQAETQTVAPSCQAALASLLTEWNAVGYAEPSKPSQMIVVGMNGRTTTAGHYYYLRQEIRASARACEADRQDEAMQHINTVHVALDIDGNARPAR